MATRRLSSRSTEYANVRLKKEHHAFSIVTVREVADSAAGALMTSNIVSASCAGLHRRS